MIVRVGMIARNLAENLHELLPELKEAKAMGRPTSIEVRRKFSMGTKPLASEV